MHKVAKYLATSYQIHFVTQKIKPQSVQILSQNHGLSASKGTKPAHGFPKTRIDLIKEHEN
jgi:hypothetical protein